MRNATAAASSALVLVTISIIAPVLVLGQFFVRQAIVSVQMLQDAGGKRSFDFLLERFPPLARAIEHSSEFITLGDVVQRAAQFVGSHLIAVLSNSVEAISQLIIMLFLLFFLYRDEETMTRVFTRLLPLTGSETRVLMKRLGDTLNATVVGRIVVATIQGIVAGALFAFLGVRAAAVLALLTTVLGLIPPFGPYVVWIPVALWLGLTGHWIKMVVLLGAGTLIISSLDNFLYPALVGAHLRQHTAFVFLSILGGIWLFGISGVVIGPLMFSASEALLAIWRSRLGGDSGALES
jgi:predicted PurR-regulated permease PerM